MSAFKRLGITSKTVSTATRPLSNTQEQTKSAFSHKWSKRDAYESEAMVKACQAWLFELFCDNDPSQLDQWLAGERKIILDAGCGSGFSAALFFGERLRFHDYLGVDISDAIEIGKQRFQELNYPGEFLQCNLMDLPFAEGTIDIVFANGVLHHTDSTQRSIQYLSGKLKPGGLFIFYVYAKKTPIREFADDYVRKKLAALSDEEAWEALKPISKLGQALGKLQVDLEVPEDIPLLGIKKGKIDIQRFIYWNFCKLYYRSDFTLEEMNHVNFDWFRPANCWRHTQEEVISFCNSANLKIERFHAENAGIAVIARKS